MNFNNILVGITLLISLITLYTIYNVNNNMDKLLLDDASDDVETNIHRLHIINRQNSNSRTIIDMITSMMKYTESNIGSNQRHIIMNINKLREDIQRAQGKQYRLLYAVAGNLGVPTAK